VTVSLQCHITDNATICRQGDMSAVRSGGPVPCAMLMQTAVLACPPQVTGNDTFVQYLKTKGGSTI
jgi:hypothetical protein